MDNIVTRFLSRHPLYLIFLTILLTAYFSYVSSSDNSIDEVSFDTGGKIFELNKKIGENFQSPYHFTSVILESRSDDIFTPEAFSEILNNQNKLIDLDNNLILSKSAGINEDNYLFNLTDFETGRESTGVTSIVDITDEFIKTHMNIPDGVNGVNKNQLKFALDKILASEKGNELLGTISRDDIYTKVKNVSNELGQYNEWSSKALLVNVILDNEKLGGGTFNVGLGGDQATLNKEYLGREIIKVLAGNENNYKLWPIAVDVNLYSQEQGETSGVYLTLTVIVAILIAGLSLRSFYTVSIIGFGISALILWLKGISAILGIKGGLIVDFIVPIAMVSLGVDFAIHAIRRYQESKISHPKNMTKALSFGLAAVSGALILAVLSDSLAFLSNAVTGIESLMHFGFSAAIATFSSFFLLGIIAPIVYMQTDKWLIQYNQNTRHINPVLRIFAGVLAASTAGISVILTVAINPGYGGLVLAGYILIFLVLPIIYLKIFGSIGQIVKEEKKSSSRKRIFKINFNPVTLFTNLTNYRYIVIFVTIIITMYSGYYALKLKPTFDVKDFFDPNSEFVIGLDKMDEYFSDSAGEPAEIYFEGKLDSLKFINTLNSFTLTLDENKYVGQDLNGSTQYYEFTVLHLMEAILSNDFAKNIYSTHPDGNKKNITDNDNNLIENSDSIFGEDEDQDLFAFRSQQKTARAQQEGVFAEEIVPVSIPRRKQDPLVFDTDEHPRASTLEKLAALPAPFRENGSVTAGNASGVNDGAAAMLVASEAAVKQHGLKPMAKILGMATAGVEPRIMGIGPVPAVQKLLKKQGISLNDIDVIELNEAFAAQGLAVLRELGIADDDPRVNPNGGAIALGHPLGMSGARLLQTAAHQLQRTGGRYALCTMCVGVGQGIATLIERV